MRDSVSLVGCSAAACVDAAVDVDCEDTSYQRVRKRQKQPDRLSGRWPPKRPEELTPAKPSDALSPDVCRRCGLVHPRSIDCITVLRDLVATLQFRQGKAG